MMIVFHDPNRGMALFDSHFQIDDVETEIDCKVLVEFNYAYMGGVHEVEVTNIVAMHKDNTILEDIKPHLQWMSDMFMVQIRQRIKDDRAKEEEQYLYEYQADIRQSYVNI